MTIFARCARAPSCPKPRPPPLMGEEPEAWFLGESDGSVYSGECEETGKSLIGTNNICSEITYEFFSTKVERSFKLLLSIKCYF